MTPEFKQLIVDGNALAEAGRGDEMTLDQSIAGVIWALEQGGFDPSKGLAKLDNAKIDAMVELAISQGLITAAMVLLNESMRRAIGSVTPMSNDEIDQMLAETLAKDPSKILPDDPDGTVH